MNLESHIATCCIGNAEYSTLQIRRSDVMTEFPIFERI